MKRKAAILDDFFLITENAEHGRKDSRKEVKQSSSVLLSPEPPKPNFRVDQSHGPCVGDHNSDRHHWSGYWETRVRKLEAQVVSVVTFSSAYSRPRLPTNWCTKRSLEGLELPRTLSLCPFSGTALFMLMAVPVTSAPYI